MKSYIAKLRLPTRYSLQVYSKAWFFDNSYLLAACVAWTVSIAVIAFGLLTILPTAYLPLFFLLMIAAAILLKWIIDACVLARFRQFDDYFRMGLQQRGISSSLPDEPIFTLHRWHDLFDKVLDRLYQDAHSIREVESRYQSILNTQSEFVFKIDENGFMVYANKAFKEFGQLDSAENELFLTQDFLMDKIVAQVIGGQENLLERLQHTPGGLEFSTRCELSTDMRDIQWHAFSVQEHGLHETAPIDYVFVGRDVTSARQLEEQARKLESLATVGRSASFICHEVSQPLSVIELATRNLLDLHREQLLNAKDIEEKSEKILSQVTRISRITRELINFGRYCGEQDSAIDLRAMIRDCLTQYESSVLAEKIELNLDLGDEQSPLLIRGNPTLFQQVIHNLLENSSYALRQNKPDHPRISISTAYVQHQVQLRITDNAGGVAQADLQKLMTPFYSTKPPGEGSGIGLAFCFDVVQKLAGTIECANTDNGLSVAISIPADTVRQSAA